MTTSETSNCDHFASECADLFGVGWEYEVARRLGINTRSVKRWASGETPLPDEVGAFLRFWRGSARP